MTGLLPVGSVVSLGEAGTLEVMVMGYYPVAQDASKTYTYLGVLYPLGVSSLKTSMMFDEKHIHEVLFTGYETEESAALCETLPKLTQADIIETLTRFQDKQKNETSPI